jgi:DNA polymerase I-like protein with 3'-5' exonuclease and polymerase domains
MLIKERELKPLVLNPPPNIVKVLDADGVEKLLNFLEKTPDFGYDVETTVTNDFYWRRMRTMQFGTAQEQYVIDLRAFCDNSADLLYDCQGEYGKNLHKAPKLQQLLQKLTPYLCSDKWIKTGVNLSFECESLYWMFGIAAYGWYDCLLAEKCLYAGLGGKASLKNYDFYAMDSMAERYFGVIIDKELQTSFNLEDEITDAQYEYAALDTRMPLAIKMFQNIIASGETVASLEKAGKPKLAEQLCYLDSLILGDNLHEVIKIENEALGAFVFMHVHGERIDTERWLARVAKSKVRLEEILKSLDKIFIPIVGSKHEAIDDAKIAALELKWKSYNIPFDEEITLLLKIKEINKQLKKFPDTPELQSEAAQLQIKLSQIEQDRKALKEVLKKECGDLKKKRTKINKLKADCEGEALINYGSDAQLMHCLRDNFKQLAKIETLDDELLEKYEHIPVMKLIREYHGVSKEIGTYGDAWATQWKTKPGKEEGWLHPGDGRLHSTFNQYDAGTGRSSSSQPNGQNLPQDTEVRHCFIADDPNEDIQLSDCCNESVFPDPSGPLVCSECACFCKTHAEEYVIVTADMSGAELRIIAEDSGDPQWVGAFERGEDLHSAGTELLYETEWHKEALPDCKYYIPHDEKSLAKYPKAKPGDPKKEKCKCPGHKVRRDDTKACNFLLAYGGGPATLAANIKKPLKVAKQLMALHEQKNPGVWKYLEASGKKAARDFKAFDLYGRRRILPQPTHARATENCKEYNEKMLRLSDEDKERNLNAFVTAKGRKPTKDEEFELTHRKPTANEISRSYYQMSNSIERQGKNMRIQGTNASIAKIAMGAGYDPDGKPFLWHTLPQYRAKLIKFVHDELVVSCPKQYGSLVAALIGDAFKRAAAIKMKKVIMEFDYNIGPYWSK